MKSIRIALSGLVLASVMMPPAFAESNIVRIMAPIAQGSPWVTSATEYGEWQNAGSPSGCTYSPLASEVEQGAGFVQSATGCTQHQTQTATHRQTNRHTGEFRVVSTQVSERDLQGYSFSQQMVGEKAPAYQCGTRNDSNYWNEYFSVTGVPLGMAAAFNGVQIINNFSPSGAPQYANLTDQASGETLTRGARTDIGQANGITTGYYGICHGK